MPQKGQAIRGFSDLVQDKSSSVNKHPGDYKLYELAKYDDNTGKFTSLPQPEFICHAIDFIEPNPKGN